MSNSSGPRVKRGPGPEKPLRQSTYRDALPYLKRDFMDRCAYSMQHTKHCLELEVDHFDPRRKKDKYQHYENLLPASRHCNSVKSDNWPSISETKRGIRFLNPCEEMDYGEQIFENPDTHELYGITPAARYHIIMCGLNAPFLVNEREQRCKYRRDLYELPVQVDPAHIDKLHAILENYKEMVDKMIPPIPAGPLPPYSP